MRNRKRAPRISNQERLLTQTCYLALRLIEALLQQSARGASMPINYQPSTLNSPMNPDHFEPSEGQELPSLADVLKTAEEHAAIDQDLRDASSLDIGPGTLDSQGDCAERLDDSQLSTINPQLLIHPAKGESESAWNAFLIFLDLAPKGGTNADVAKATGTSISTIKYWSSRFRWRQRLQHLNAQAMDSRLEAQKQEQKKAGIDWAKRAQEQAELEWALSGELLDTARQSMSELTLTPETITLQQIATAIQTGIKIQRQSVERATKNEATPSNDIAALRAQLLANAKKAYAKARTTEAR